MDHVAAVSALVEKHFSGLPGHHGWEHISRVVSYCHVAVKSQNDSQNGSEGHFLTENEQAIVLVAALLHDADDLKIFPESRDLEHARGILRDSGFPPELWGKVLDSVKLVSCSTQNQAEGEIVFQKWQLIPRDADRLDAVGAQGVKRCLEYASGRKMFVDSTPLPVNRDDVIKFATPERFEVYKAGGKSLSTLDHFFDKLLHLTCSDSGNHYLTEQGKIAREEMLDLLLPMLIEAKAQRDATVE